ncbi:hypothetical protein SAMN05660862_0250 [Sphingobacterium psychroaquaticum]|uniref:Uncharacterized protein n=1 Tax=Sphingobacterium psychroaquaticum TaxID=561061 RepID=A0A1X7HZH6_9SPHI|nr:hypothetical protein SAMN05660862_0250 [Sphingobacterium psychroaquaticum]
MYFFKSKHSFPKELYSKEKDLRTYVWLTFGSKEELFLNRQETYVMCGTRQQLNLQRHKKKAFSM